MTTIEERIDTIDNHMRRAVELAAMTYFTLDYQNVAPRDELEAEALGNAVARWARWDVFQTLRVCMAALEDANLHSESATVAAWLHRWEKEIG